MSKKKHKQQVQKKEIRQPEKKRKSIPKEHLIAMVVCLVGFLICFFFYDHYSAEADAYKDVPKVRSAASMTEFTDYEGKILIEGNLIEEDGRNEIYSETRIYERVIEEDKNGKESVSYKVIDSHSSRSKHLTIYDIPIDTASMKFEGLKRTGYSDELHEYYVISGPEHHAVVAAELRDGILLDGKIFCQDGYDVDHAVDYIGYANTLPFIGMCVFIGFFLFVLLSLVLTLKMDQE